MPEYRHERHKSPTRLAHPRELILAVPSLRSHVNLARIIRAAGCSGIQRVIAGGKGKIDPKVARDALDQIQVERHRSLRPSLVKLKEEGYSIVGLEQATGSLNIHEFSFLRKTVLVLGHERLGITEEILRLLDAVIEIPVYGKPDSYNVATAAAMAMYEYCRQFPH